MCFICSRKQEWAWNRISLEELLAWLTPVQKERGKSYEYIRGKLKQFFEGRNCIHPEECTDETLDRIATRIHDGREIPVEKPAAYCIGVARNVWREYHRCPHRKNDPLPDERGIQTAPLVVSPARTLRELVEEEQDEQKRVAELKRRLAEKHENDRQHNQCRETCLKELDRRQRTLYNKYRGKNGESSEATASGRKQLAKKMKITLEALRNRIMRINDNLSKCIDLCVAQTPH